MAKQKVKIALLGSMKEFQTEVDDKKKFTKEIEELIQNGGMYWIKDDDGEIGINAKQIHSIEFVDDTDKREAGLVEEVTRVPVVLYSLLIDFLSSSVVPPQTPES